MTVVVRETKETKIRLELTRGGGAATAATGLPFLDHMMITFARYANLGITLEASGDLKHHLIEDVAIATGAAIAALGAVEVARYGDRTIPMDDALVTATLDVGGRAYYEGRLPSALYDHWMRSFAENAKTTLHIRVLRGTDRHHIVEAAFKALGYALQDALLESPGGFSTKGSVSMSVT